MDPIETKGRVSRYIVDTVLILVGIFLAFWPAMVKGIIIKIIAVAILFYGVLLVIKAIPKKKQIGYIYYAVGGVFILVGILMIIASNFFFGLIVFILGATVCYLGFTSLFSLLKSRKQNVFPAWYISFPVAMILCGAAMFFYPDSSGNTIFIISGLILIVFGCSEILYLSTKSERLTEARTKIGGATSCVSAAAGKVTDMVKDDVAYGMDDMMHSIKEAGNVLKRGDLLDS